MDTKLNKILDDNDIMNVAKYAANLYSCSLSKDDIQNCIYNATWKALKSFDKTKGVKFTTFLHKGVRLQCQKRINFLKKHKHSPYYEGAISARFNNNFKNQMYSQDLIFEIKDEIENCEDPDIMYDRFYNNMTLAEIAEKKNTSYETIRNKINKNLKIIKTRLS